MSKHDQQANDNAAPVLSDPPSPELAPPLTLTGASQLLLVALLRDVNVAAGQLHRGATTFPRTLELRIRTMHAYLTGSRDNPSPF